ncbi:MAG: 50S ribosomal protein L15e [archaeon]
MGYLKYVREAWKKPKENIKANQRARLIQWRQEPVTVRMENSTRPDRARSLGYKAKQGFIIVRQRVARGKRQREKFSSGRRPAHMRRKKVVAKNYQQIAEERANKKYVNCEVLNSYPVGEDGRSKWFEIILVDRAHPQILADKRINWIIVKRGRAYRGLTSAAKKSRGLRKKGTGAEKIRPSLRARGRRH